MMSENSKVSVSEPPPGCISSECLLRYEEEDEWYFSDGETDAESDSSTSEEHEEESILPRKVDISIAVHDKTITSFTEIILACLYLGGMGRVVHQLQRQDDSSSFLY